MKTALYIGIIYFIIISAVGIFMTVKDKNSAINGKKRIPEKTLMLVGLLGGALPMFITMNMIHHKTKHFKFMLGLPAEIILQIAIIFAVAYFTTTK